MAFKYNELHTHKASANLAVLGPPYENTFYKKKRSIVNRKIICNKSPVTNFFFQRAGVKVSKVIPPVRDFDKLPTSVAD